MITGPRAPHIIDAHTVRAFRFNQSGAGDAVVDAAGGPSLLNVGGNNPSVPGQISTARSFSNGNYFTSHGAVYAADRTRLQGDRTFEWWVKLDSAKVNAGGAPDYTCLVSVADYNSFTGVLGHLELHRIDRRFRYLFHGGGGALQLVQAAPSSFTLDGWHHVAVTHAKTSGTVNIYADDAVLLASVTGLPVADAGTVGSVCVVGAFEVPTFNEWLGDGDAGRISDCVRTTAELSESYHRGRGLYPSNDPQPEAYSLKRLLPPGKVWALGSNSSLSKWLAGAAEELHRVKLRGDAIVEESDPRTATETLDEWEQELEITDIAGTTAARRLAVTSKLIALGGQTPAYYVQIAAACGYTVTIADSGAAAVSRAGRARAGDRVLTETNAFRWTVVVQAPAGTALTHAQLEAAISRAAPAHTIVSFTYL